VVARGFWLVARLCCFARKTCYKVNRVLYSLWGVAMSVLVQLYMVIFVVVVVVVVVFRAVTID